MLLQQAAGQPSRERLAIVREWIERQFKGGLRTEALEKLQQLETDLAAQTRA